MYLYVYVDIEYIDILSYFFNLLRVFYEYIQYVFFYIDWHGHTIHKSLCVLVLFAYDSTIISSTKPP